MSVWLVILLLVSRQEVQAYKEIPYVHSWVALQAWTILPEDDAKKEIGNYLYGAANSNLLFSADKVWLNQYVVPLNYDPTNNSLTRSTFWSADTKTGDSILEGAYEEDVDSYDDTEIIISSFTNHSGVAVLHHFWNPDVGYAGGINDGLFDDVIPGGLSVAVHISNLQQAQIWWERALQTYALGVSAKPLAYYYLGRVAHLLGDLGVPEHVNGEVHVGGHLPYEEFFSEYLRRVGVSPGQVTKVTRSLYSNYEEYTKLHYREFVGIGAPKDYLSLQPSFPMYSDAPSTYDTNLATLFYNQAIFTKQYDSSRHNGSLEAGSARMAYRAVDYVDSDLPDVGDAVANDGIDPGETAKVVWHRKFTGDELELFEGPHGDYWFDLARGKGQIMYSPALYEQININVLDLLSVTYVFRGTTNTFETRFPDVSGTYYAVPDRNVANQMAILFPENIRYTAALYQLFWERTHLVITTLTQTPSGGVGTGGTVVGGGVAETNSTVTVTATPFPGNDFVNWTQDGSIVSTSPAYTFTATTNRTLIANFDCRTLPPAEVVSNSQPISLRVVAKSGDLGIVSIRSGVSINNRGTVAFSAIASGNRSTVFSRASSGPLNEPRPDSGLVSGYGVQINDQDDIAFLVGPGISGSDYCVPNPLPPFGCLETVSDSQSVYAILSINAVDPSPTRTLMYSLIYDFYLGGVPRTQNGPFSGLGPSFSLNNTGQVAFLGDINTVFRGNPSYVLATTNGQAGYQLIPADILTRPLLADNGRIVLRSGIASNSPVEVREYNLAQSVPITDQNTFTWTGQSPGITEEGNHIAFVAAVGTNNPCLGPGPGLFLSSFTNGQWITRRILGTNDSLGTNMFQRFHEYYRTCVTTLASQSNAVKICFGAASPTGRVGLYSVTYDFDRNEALSLTTLVEAGLNVAGLGLATGFELFDSVNRYGEIAFWVTTPQGDAVVRTGREVQAIDPLPKLVDDGVITADPVRLAASTNRVRGLAADGVTRVVLRVETPAAGQATFRLEAENGGNAGVGTLSALGSTNEVSVVQANAVDIGGGRFMAFAILKAPIDFTRAGSFDELKVSRNITVDVQFRLPGENGLQLLARQPINLYRPPVVLLHGIWSDAGTWEWPLLHDSRFLTHAHDYRDTHAASFEENFTRPREAIDIALTRARRELGIAAVQVDFIGHSMGGLLARRYIGRADSGPLAPPFRYRNASNYFAGDIHKLITVDTPHRGTPAADIIRNGSPISQMLEAAFWYNDKCVDCGAVDNLRTFDEAIVALPAASVPAHAIVATGGRHIFMLPETDLAQIQSEDVGALRSAIEFAATEEEVFGVAEHDELVTEESQRGGLSGSHVSVYQFDSLIEPGAHTTVTMEDRIWRRVVGLLHTNVAAGAFALDGFPANPFVPAPTPDPTSNAASRPAPLFTGLSIISPESGKSVIGGASVSVTIAPTNGFQPTKVLIVGPWGSDLDEGAPFDLAMKVPTNWLGPLLVKAFGVGTNGMFAESPEIVLNVTTAAALTNITIQPDTVYLFDYARTKQVAVYGNYSDGVERKLSPPQFAFTYSADNLTIARVDANGLVEAQRTGNTTVRVQVGGLKASAPVLVLGTQFTNNTTHLTQKLEIVELGTNVWTLNDLNNAGQVLVRIANPNGSNYRPAIWENGTITPLIRPPDVNNPAANALSESGVVSGGNGLAILWLSPTNFVYLTNPDGSMFIGPHGAGLVGVHDSASGLIGLAGLGGGPGIGRPPPGTYFRLSGTQVVLPPITAQGVPAGYEWTPGQKLNSSGTLIGHVDKFEGDVQLSTRPATLDVGNQVTVLEGWDGNGAANAINDAGDVVGYLPGGYAALWHDAKLTVLWTNTASATAINNRGDVAVYRGPVPGGNGGAIWANGRIVTLNDLFAPLGWTGFGAIAAMNDNGWLICTASRGQGGENVLIKLAPAVRQQPISRTKVPGQSVAFSVGAYGIGDISYQWRKDGTNLDNGARISGADTTNLTIHPIQTGDAGGYDLVITDTYGTATSSNAVLTTFAQGCLPAPAGLVAHWSGDGTDQEALNRFSANLMNRTGYSNGLVNSAFAFDGVDDHIQTDLDVNPSVMPITTWEGWIYPTRTNYVDYQGIFGDLKDYRVLYITGGDQFTVSGALGALTNVSLNEWQHIAVIFYSNYVEFYKNSQRFTSGYVPQTSSGLSLLTIGSRGGSSFPFQGLLDEVSIYNRALSQAEIKAIYDVGSAGKCRPVAPPTITSQPTNQITYAGFDMTFTAATLGSATLNFQWYFNGTNAIANATNRQFTLRNAQAGNAGAYRVLVSNAFGSVTSSVANLIVRPACEGLWTQASSAPEFCLPFATAMSFDSARGVVVVLYGASSSGCAVQTWEWNANNWRRGSTTGPSKRDGTKMVYDSGRQVTVLFGGGAGGLLNDTWEWDGTNWMLAASSGPAPRSEHGMAFDSARGVTVLFGGYKGPGESFGDTWEWDGISWVQACTGVPTCLGPGARRGHQMVFDSDRQKIILFGGYAGTYPDSVHLANDTWEWDGTSWTQIPAIQSPPARSSFSMVYDSERHSTILYGGLTANCLDDTWELVGDSWIQVPTQGPGPRCNAVMAYDSVRNVVVLGSWKEVWEWSVPQVPIFLQQPLSQTHFVGETASFSACATGQGSVNYQWFFNGTSVSEATQPALVLNSVQPTQAGEYTVVASNTYGAVTSVVARLIVLPCQSAPPSAVAWWRAERDILDSVNTNHGAFGNGTSFSSGKVGQAFQFDGFGDYVKVKASPNLNLNAAQGLTVEGWIRPGALTPRPLVEWNFGTNHNASVGVHLWVSGPTNNAGAGALFANLRGTNLVDHVLFSAPGVLAANSFQHVAMTYDRPTGLLKLYRNGGLLAQQAVGSFRTATTSDLYLGYRPGETNSFAGLIDEMTIYNRALASNEVASIFLAGAVGKCLEPDGQPYVYFNGVNYSGQTVTLVGYAPIEVTLLSTFGDSTIRYSLDNSSPTNGFVYDGSFALTQSATLAALAYSTSGTPSQIVTARVNFVAATAPTLNGMNISAVPPNSLLMVFRGMPGKTYILERSSDLVAWETVMTVFAPPYGILSCFLPSEPDKPYFVQDPGAPPYWDSNPANLAIGNFITLADPDGPKRPHQFYRWALPEAFGRIASVNRQPNGVIELVITGLENRTYTIQASNDLVDWQDIGTGIVSGGTLQFFDANAGSFAARYYRLKSAR